MAVSIDDDTLQAVRALWLRSEGLPALFDRPPETGRLKAREDMTRSLPYAHLACKSARSEAHTRTVLDTRTVTITVVGTKAQATAAMEAIQAVFTRRLGAPGQETLAYPSGARLVQGGWRPSPDGGRLEQDETVRRGEDVWRGIIEAEVTSARGMT